MAYFRSMSATAFDAYAAAKTLREVGFDERQAEAAVTEGIATRGDLDKGFAALIKLLPQAAPGQGTAA